ncbi:hypothetical protein IV102_16190 [bacterium]|nr:hypothetical protein [bacterium]
MRYLLPLLFAWAAWGAPSEKVIFSLEKDAEESHLDPIAILRGGKFLEPASGKDGVALGKGALAFFDRYYAKEATYRVLEGGSVQVKDCSSAQMLANEIAVGGSGAWSMSASAVAPAMARPRGLALNFEPEGAREPAKAASNDQKARFLAAFKRGPGKSLKWLPRARVTELVSTDLDHDGRAEWIGTLKGGQSDYLTGALMVTGPSGQSLLERSGGSQYYEYLDSLDCDGDGVDELFFRRNGEGGWNYIIFQRKNGTWKSVYSGGGGGC